MEIQRPDSTRSPVFSTGLSADVFAFEFLDETLQLPSLRNKYLMATEEVKGILTATDSEELIPFRKRECLSSMKRERDILSLAIIYVVTERDIHPCTTDDAGFQLKRITLRLNDNTHLLLGAKSAIANRIMLMSLIFRSDNFGNSQLPVRHLSSS
jgi:hypothetical protein